MKIADIERSERIAKYFIQQAKARRQEIEEHKQKGYGEVRSTAISGSLRRASMELTRSLAVMRKG